jgi:hypothetical protein
MNHISMSSSRNTCYVLFRKPIIEFEFLVRKPDIGWNSFVPVEIQQQNSVTFDYY